MGITMGLHVAYDYDLGAYLNSSEMEEVYTRVLQVG